MSSEFSSFSEIKRQLNATQQTIQNFTQEVSSDDLERYPNVDDHLSNLTRALDAGWGALMSIQDKNIQEAPDVVPLAKVTSQAISILSDKASQEKTSALVAALAALQQFQEALSEMDFDEITKRNQIRIEKSDTDNRS